MLTRTASHTTCARVAPVRDGDETDGGGLLLLAVLALVFASGFGLGWLVAWV